MSNISGTIKSVQDIMRKDAGVDGDAQRISQLAWMIFFKVFSDKEKDHKVEAELAGKTYVSPIPENLKWSSWASDDEGITGDALLNFVNNELFSGLKELEVTDVKDRANIVRSVFEDSFNYMKSGTLLRQVINVINDGIDFTKQEERHLFNDIYETILKGLQSAGNAGEYYTPRAVTQFIVEMVNPKLGEKVLDPACGTAGFLVNTIEHIRSNNEVNTVEDREILQNSIRGVEKKPLPHMLATTNLILHNISYPSINHDNLLSRSLTDWTNKDRVDVVVTNPPFGGMEEDGVERNFPASFRTRETADLFLYLIMHALKDGGRCGMVLPDGFLFGDGVTARIKEKLFETCNLHTIIKLPNGVFNPYTNIKSNLLFFEKGQKTDDIWFYEHQYPEGYKSYSKTRPMIIDEFDIQKQWWNNRQENQYSWKTNVKEVVSNNYNLDIKNPSQKPADKLDNPELLIERILETNKTVESILLNLKNMMKN